MHTANIHHCTHFINHHEVHTTEPAAHASVYTLQQDIQYSQHVTQQRETSGTLGIFAPENPEIPFMQHAQQCKHIKELQKQCIKLHTQYNTLHAQCNSLSMQISAL